MCRHKWEETYTTASITCLKLGNDPVSSFEKRALPFTVICRHEMVMSITKILTTAPRNKPRTIHRDQHGQIPAFQTYNKRNCVMNQLEQNQAKTLFREKLTRIRHYYFSLHRTLAEGRAARMFCNAKRNFVTENSRLPTTTDLGKLRKARVVP